MRLTYAAAATVAAVVAALAASLLVRSRSAPPGPPASPYVAQLASPVRGLSVEEVDDLLNGRGAGFARTAELNGYPGPRHVLDHGNQLALTPEQRGRTEVLFASMQAEAKRLGAEIVRREERLSQAFRAGSLSRPAMLAQVDTLGGLYGDLRATHLAAHLELKHVLTAGQIARYDSLRGYGSRAHGDTSGHRH